MEIHRTDERTIELRDLDSFLCELLQQIPESADPSGSVAASERIYSSPTQGRQPQLDEEWRSYVEPELREQFRSAMEVVKGDVEGMSAGEEGERCVITVPIEHFESWINALNQARLVLAARHEVTEADMESMPMGGDRRALAIFQIHLYGYLQECFLRELGN